MGELHAFSCKACGYHAQVSGGKDRGFVAFTQTKVCQDCLQVVDVSIGKATEMRAEKSTPIPDSKQKCPICKGHNLKVWKDRICPKCNGKMKKWGMGPVCMWD